MRIREVWLLRCKRHRDLVINHLLTRGGLRIAAAVDHDPGKIGHDLGVVIGARSPFGVPVSEDGEA
ncbi:MAG: hypothetical protein QXO32_06730 [Candidatus Bathyarchaeia archaeon]